MRLEEGILAECIKELMDEDYRGSSPAGHGDAREWEEASIFASRHGLLPLMYRSFMNGGACLEAPPEKVAQWKQRYYAVAYRNTLFFQN